MAPMYMPLSISMTEFLQAVVQYDFLRNALIAGLLASLGCGVVGSYVVVRRIGFLAGGIAHSVLGGIGAALYFGFDPTLAAFATAIVAAIIIGLVSRYGKEREDTLIAALWAAGMAIGVIFISLTPGYNTELMSYLFGNILMVSTTELWIMTLMDGLILLLVGLFYKQFLAVSFDEEFATLRGVPVTLFHLLLLILVAVTVVLLIQVVGLILVIALLTIPAAIAGHFTRTLAGMMLIGTLLGILFSSGGLVLSWAPDLPPGPVIILLAAAMYIVSLLFTRLFKRN